MLRAGLMMIAAGALALAGCTSTAGKGSTAPSGNRVSSSTPATSAPPPSSSPAPPPTATSSSHSAGTACTAAQLTVRGGALPGGSAAGHIGVLLNFINHSTSTCTLDGYPGVAGVASGGAQIAQATRTLSGYLAGCGCSAPPTVTLVPDAIASAVTEGDVGGGTCDTFASLLVTPPNTATSTRVDRVPHGCGFTVHPVVAGTATG